MQQPGRINKLKWLCRRGMKELDVLLEGFLDQHQQELSEGRWPELESLLQNEDDQLWDWVQKPASAQASAYRAVLEEIRGGSA
jgi:antitoxin CptB